MVRIHLLVIMLLGGLTGFTQSNTGVLAGEIKWGNDLHSTYTLNHLAYTFSKPVQIVNIPNLSGSPFLSSEFKPGYVRVKNGYEQNNVPIRFNVFQNAIEFRRGDMELELDFLDYAVYLDNQSDSSTIHIFKTGYPPIDGQSEQSIYEVLYWGERVHVLSYLSQKIEPVKYMGEFDKKELVTTRSYYLYLPAQGLKKVKLSEEAFKKVFPAHAKSISHIIKNKSLNIKKVGDLQAFVHALDQLLKEKE